MRPLLAMLAMATAASGFVPPPVPIVTPTTTTSSTTLEAKSKAVPFLDAPKALDGSLVGDVGFDPCGFSDLPWDFSYLIVPTRWEESRTGLPALSWLREAELKHCRLAMLAVLGWVAVDLGLRFPGSKYAGLSSLQAHDALVKTGDMTVGFFMIGFVEVVTGVAIYEMSKGSDRAPGDYSFDPLGLGKGEKSRLARYALSELKNGRLAMLAFAGIATQAALTGHGFPYVY